MKSATLKKIFNIVSTVIVAIVVLIAVFLMGSRLVGLNVYNVISGSMEPTYSVGDLIYVKSIDYEDVAEKVLHKSKDIVTLDKAHLNIKLSELKLSVASWVFVTIASGDLEIFVETGNHQYLLIKLR